MYKHLVDTISMRHNENYPKAKSYKCGVEVFEVNYLRTFCLN